MKKRLAIKSDAKINYVGVSDYASSITKKTSGDKIAILYAEGGIADGEGNDEGVYSKDMVKEIRKIAKDKSIKGLVLRVNSPGGSALASDVIYHELEVLHRSIPIIVSMGNYAASGGYYIACASDSLIADKNTLTGSIGVVGVLMNVGDFYKNKLGITTDVIKTSNYGLCDVQRNSKNQEPAEFYSNDHALEDGY
jgi:protease-4